MKGLVELIIRPPLARWLLAGLVALFIVPWIAAPVSADGNYLGVLKATPPLSPPFINSPASYDISSHPVTVVFSIRVENLTQHIVTVTVDVGVHHILTYYGRNIADGEPGKAGTIIKAVGPPNLTEETYGTPFKMQFTVEPRGAPPQLVTFKTVVKRCGYFQFDMGKHENGVQANLAVGYARVLGCKAVGGGTGGVGAASATGPHGEVLAGTGIPVAGGLLGALMVLVGGLGMRFRRR